MRFTSRLRSCAVVAIAHLALAPAFGASATPLPPEFGGGFVPPSDAIEARERRALQLAVDLLAMPENSLLYCGWRGVERLRGDRPSGVTECFARSEAIYGLKVGRLSTLPACVDADLARQTVESAALAANGFLWCDPPAGTPLPPEFGGGFLPPDRPTFLGEKAAATAFARLVRRTVRCYRVAVADIVDGHPTDLPDCLAEVEEDYADRLARIVPPRRILPACSIPPTIAAVIANSVAQALNPIVYCEE